MVKITCIPHLLVAMVCLALGGCGPVRDTHERLHSTLWIQTSAEYRILARQQFRAAQAALDQALQDRSWSAVLEQTNVFHDLPPAIIVDLDETVLDNTPFEASLIKDRNPFNYEQFDEWVAKADAPAVPGAVTFIRYAQKQGVTVFFVTNRYARHESATRRNLERLSIHFPDEKRDTVLSIGEPPFNWAPDKAARRAFIATNYRILLLIGDDLGDFVSGAQNPPDIRKQLADQHSDRWGKSWFLLPNPIYGSWETSLYPKHLTDRQILDFKHELLK